MSKMSFSVNQKKAIALLANGINFRQCCKMLKITRTTLWQWRQKPEFQEAVEKEKAKFVDDYRQELDNLRLKAVKQLSEYLDSPSIPMDKKISICFDSLHVTRTFKVNYINLE